MRPNVDAGLCIESSRGSSQRAAAAFSRASWGVFRKKDFSAVAATPCGTLSPREDGEVRRLGEETFLLCWNAKALALWSRWTWMTAPWRCRTSGPLAGGLQRLGLNPGCNSRTESYRRDQRHWGCCCERRGQLMGRVGRRTRQQAILNQGSPWTLGISATCRVAREGN
jgi:hypothetical protein